MLCSSHTYPHLKLFEKADPSQLLIVHFRDRSTLGGNNIGLGASLKCITGAYIQKSDSNKYYRIKLKSHH